MKRQTKTDTLTELVLEVFRLNGVLLEAGDRMTSTLELTSARWQVLGAISIAEEKLTVAQIGKKMGLSRQAVQRVVNDLERLGFVSLHTNPHHKKARLVGLTDRSLLALEELEVIQSKWAHDVVAGLSGGSLTETVETLKTVRTRCEERG